MLYRELEQRRLRFRPHCWLADEWFTPDGVPGIAIPFYLAHPRLARLELNQLLEVEGGTRTWCLRILRHEAGHAIDNAFRLQLRRRRQQLFGLSSTPYPEYYTPKPHSRRFVLHLDAWYAQSHPDEDFAETFAVWLDPQSDWRTRYAEWPAAKKLEYVDQLMTTLADQPPVVTTRRTVDRLTSLRHTLRDHYAAKRKRFGLNYPNFYDRDLRKLFSDASAHARHVPAARFLTRIRPEVRRLVARWTGEYQYRIDQVLNDMIERCDQLQLGLASPDHEATLDFIVLLTVHTMNYLHGGRHRIAL
ncbi:MAG: putative zinc-binding metallopeptidase [Acidobacteriota bacterium]|nr:putative zinc-binding metallopeptidase [Acidobacteriota bacterium]